MFERKQENPVSTYIQPSLEIGKEYDEHEKEANSVADKVMCMREPGVERKMMATGKRKVQPMFNPTAGKTGTMNTGKPVVRKMSTEKSGMKASPNVEQGIHSTKGNGQSLQPELQQEMGSKIGADFGNVRIHKGSHAAEMNQEIGAKAFTHGNDIYFNKGQYDPASDHGKHLLAHELTHTVQQSGVVNKQIQRAAQKSTYGEFVDDPELKLYPDGNNSVRLPAVIKFTPNKFVNASNIGMVQVVKQKYGGKVKYAKVTDRDRLSNGYKIDAGDPQDTNPLYGAGSETTMENAAGGQDMAYPAAGIQGPTYEMGSFTPDQKEPKQAVLRDAPKAAIKEGNSQEFETTAYATAGVQKGMYYGSVKWGWKVEGGKPLLIPLKIVSIDVPSTNFFGAASKWNKSKTMGTARVRSDEAVLYLRDPQENKLKDSGETLSKGDSVDPFDIYEEGGKIYNLIKSNGNTRAIALDDIESGPNGVETQKLKLHDESDFDKTANHLGPVMKGYISDQQTYMKTMDNKSTADFDTTLTGGYTYRISVAAGLTLNNVDWKIEDVKGNILFDSKEHGSPYYWDLKVTDTIDVKVSSKLKSGSFSTNESPGLVMLIGFK